MNRKSEKGNCFVYGFIILAVIILIVAVSGYFIGKRAINKLVTEYTDTEPMELPEVNISDQELNDLLYRVSAFKKALNNGQPTKPLILSGNEINALLATHENQQLKDQIYVIIEGDQIKGYVNLPLDNFHLEGRYLHGFASFKASLENGVAIVTIESLKVKDKDVPEAFMAEMRKNNLAKDIYKDQKQAELIRKFESIEIKDGYLIIKASD